jgi:hypothetical protein
MHLSLHLHLLLLIKVCIVDLSVTLVLNCLQRLSSSFHRFKSKYGLSRRQQFVATNYKRLSSIRIVHGRCSLFRSGGYAFLHSALIRHHYSVLILLLYISCIILSLSLSAVRAAPWSRTINIRIFDPYLTYTERLLLS